MTVLKTATCTPVPGSRGSRADTIYKGLPLSALPVRVYRRIDTGCLSLIHPTWDSLGVETGGHCSSKFLLTKTDSHLGQKVITEIYNRQSKASEGKFLSEFKGDLKASAEDYLSGIVL